MSICSFGYLDTALVFDEV